MPNKLLNHVTMVIYMVLQNQGVPGGTWSYHEFKEKENRNINQIKTIKGFTKKATYNDTYNNYSSNPNTWVQEIRKLII